MLHCAARNGQQPAYVYFEEEPGRRSAAKLLTKDEARRIAANIAKLPDIFEMIQLYAARLYAARRFGNERGGIASGSPVRGENPRRVSGPKKFWMTTK